MLKVNRALLSVSDKSGIVEFARSLNELGVELVSTGGTARLIKESGIPVTKVEDVTGFPEMLDGRVKTLHPFIHGGILARRTEDHLGQLKEKGITPIDMVVVNLYPFEQTISREDATLEDAVENIDIGGPTMVRSAAKNHESVAIVVNPQRYESIVNEMREKGGISEETLRELAVEAFGHTAHYDKVIYDYLRGKYKAD